MKRTKSFLRVGIALLALSGILFAGCSSGSDDDGPQLAKPVTPISGVQVYDNTGVAYAGANITFTYADVSGSNVTLTEIGLTDTNVSVTSGQLALNMGTLAPTALQEYNEDGSTVTPPSARFCEILSFKILSDGGKTLKLLKVEGGQVKEKGRLLYATEAARITAPGADINVNKGWNWVIKQDENLYTGNPDASFKWYINLED
jgi:hypothetical protein